MIIASRVCRILQTRINNCCVLSSVVQALPYRRYVCISANKLCTRYKVTDVTERVPSEGKRYPLSEADKVFTVPNVLTFSRILSTPVITYFVINGNFNLALGLFFAAGLTDIIDGYIARNWKGQSSVMGSVLDPMADKILVTALSISMAWVEILPIWLVSLILYRDFCLVVGGFYIRFVSLPKPKTVKRYFDPTLPSVEMKPLAISKFNTGVQLFLITSHLCAPVFGFLHHPYLDILCYFTGATTLLSGISYIFSQNSFTIIGKATRRSL